MQISITGRHIDISDATREHIHGKIEHALIEFRRIESVHVILDHEKHRYLAELVIKVPSHHVEAKEESPDMYLSVDAAIEKAARQLRKLLDRVQDHKGKDRLSQAESETDGASA